MADKPASGGDGFFSPAETPCLRTTCIPGVPMMTARQMKPVLKTIQDGAAYLEKRGVENGRLNMEHLLAHVLKCQRMQLYLWFDRPLEENELAPLRELTVRRGKREPLQHLLGTVEFHGREFRTDGRALIPRPETEELVERLLREAKSQSAPPARVLDMGTGSGIIGLSLAHAWPEAHVTLVDVSLDALALAQQNAESTLADAARLTWVHSNLWENLGDAQFDLVVANLPYIPAAEISTLSAEVQCDPVLALDGGVVGTELILRFLRELSGHVASGGRVALEIGMGQGAELCLALTNLGFQNATAAMDYSERERFVFAEKI